MGAALDKNICAIVLHFRTEEHTSRCIDSLISEGLRWIILIDNSEDDWLSIAKMDDVLQRWRANGILLQVESKGINLGFASAVNWGVKLAEAQGAEAILLMNSDAKFEPGALSLMCQALPGADIVVPTYRDRKGNLTSYLPHYDRVTGVVSRRAFIFGKTFFTGCCVLAKTGTLTSFPYDEDFFFYGEDVELSHRLRRAGHQEVVQRDAVVCHAVAASAGNGSLFYEYHIARSHLLLATKLADTLLSKIVFLFGRFLFLPSRALVRMFRQRSAVPFMALLLAMHDTACNKKRVIPPPARKT